MIEDRSLIQSYAVAFDVGNFLFTRGRSSPLSKTEALELANSLDSMNIPYRVSGGLWSCGLYTPCAVLRKEDLI